MPDDRQRAQPNKTVWSSDGLSPPTPKAGPVPPPTPGAVRVRLERQGRGGKAVSVVEGLPGHPAALEEVAKALKARCGAGGTVRGRTVEIQGDHRDRILAVLAERGIPAKRAGG